MIIRQEAAAVVKYCGTKVRPQSKQLCYPYSDCRDYHISPSDLRIHIQPNIVTERLKVYVMNETSSKKKIMLNDVRAVASRSQPLPYKP